MAGADGFTSTLVIEELWHLEISGRLGKATDLARASAVLVGGLLPITSITMDHAFALEANRLGSADRIHAGTCIEHGIEVIVSADRAFDELSEPRRVDPLDREALATLGLDLGRPASAGQRR